MFHSVIVVTDRRVLDQQLQATIYQFEHKTGVVEKIDEDTRQLAKALSQGTPIVITTIQKFLGTFGPGIVLPDAAGPSVKPARLPQILLPDHMREMLDRVEQQLREARLQFLVLPDICTWFLLSGLTPPEGCDRSDDEAEMRVSEDRCEQFRIRGVPG